MNIQKRSREQIVAKVAQDIPTGSFVNLGIGLPTRVAGYLKPEQGVILHSENGVFGHMFHANIDTASTHCQIHRTAYSRYSISITGMPVRQITINSDLKSPHDTDIQMPASHDIERVGRIHKTATLQHAYEFFAGVNQIIICLFRIRRKL
jgi:hypothetical protein